jgi:hypothetical protein
MASNRDLAADLAGAWESEAGSLERLAKTGKDNTPIEKRLLEMHARVKRACAQELRNEAAKVRRG